MCSTCGRMGVAEARYCSGCGQVLTAATLPFAGRLVRPRQGRFIAGVCQGFALRYGLDPVFVRLIAVLAVCLGAGSPLLAYLIAWVIMPNAPYELQASTPVSSVQV
jgi:phage shock protein C